MAQNGDTNIKLHTSPGATAKWRLMKRLAISERGIGFTPLTCSHENMAIRKIAQIFIMKMNFSFYIIQKSEDNSPLPPCCPFLSSAIQLTPYHFLNLQRMNSQRFPLGEKFFGGKSYRLQKFIQYNRESKFGIHLHKQNKDSFVTWWQ